MFTTGHNFGASMEAKAYFRRLNGDFACSRLLRRCLLVFACVTRIAVVVPLTVERSQNPMTYTTPDVIYGVASCASISAVAYNESFTKRCLCQQPNVVFYGDADQKATCRSVSDGNIAVAQKFEQFKAIVPEGFCNGSYNSSEVVGIFHWDILENSTSLWHNVLFERPGAIGIGTTGIYFNRAINRDGLIYKFVYQNCSSELLVVIPGNRSHPSGKIAYTPTTQQSSSSGITSLSTISGVNATEVVLSILPTASINIYSSMSSLPLSNQTIFSTTTLGSSSFTLKISATAIQIATLPLSTADFSTRSSAIPSIISLVLTTDHPSVIASTVIRPSGVPAKRAGEDVNQIVGIVVGVVGFVLLLFCLAILLCIVFARRKKRANVLKEFREVVDRAKLTTKPQKSPKHIILPNARLSTLSEAYAPLAGPHKDIYEGLNVRRSSDEVEAVNHRPESASSATYPDYQELGEPEYASSSGGVVRNRLPVDGHGQKSKDHSNAPDMYWELELDEYYSSPISDSPDGADRTRDAMYAVVNKSRNSSHLGN